MGDGVEADAPGAMKRAVGRHVANSAPSGHCVRLPGGAVWSRLHAAADARAVMSTSAARAPRPSRRRLGSRDAIMLLSPVGNQVNAAVVLSLLATLRVFVFWRQILAAETC